MIDANGIAWEHAEISDYLLTCFKRDEQRLWLMAACDTTRRWSLRFILNYHEMGTTDFGGTVNFNKRQQRFDFIEYSDTHNFAIRISIAAGCYYSAWDHRDFLFRNIPQFYYPEKKLAKYLLSH